MIPEVVQAFRAAMQRGEFITDAAAEAGPTGRRAPAGWSPRVVPGRAAAGTCRAAACPSLSAKSARSAGPAGVDPHDHQPVADAFGALEQRHTNGKIVLIS